MKHTHGTTNQANESIEHSKRVLLTLPVDQHDNSGTVPWTLTRRADVDASRASLVRTVNDLEDALDGCIALDNCDEDSNDEDGDDEASRPSQRPSVWYCATPDVAWLACRRPRPTESNDTSITGLCSENEQEKTAIQFTMWTLQVEPMTGHTARSHGDTSDTSPASTSQETSYDWTRRALSYRPTQPEAHRPLTVQWVDARTAQNQAHPTAWLETPASIYTLLQHILTPSHEASPWVVEPLHDERVECVLLACHASEAVVSFRVSDACPSWCLYSVVRLDLNQSPGARATPWWNCSDPCLEQPLDVLIYRRLPRRERLSSRHPLTHDPVPTMGCLWETVVTRPEPTGDDDPVEVKPVVTYRLVGPPYIEFCAEYAHGLECHLHKLLHPDHMAVLRREAARIDLWTAWPEQQHYQSSTADPASAPWTVFPLCHTFPAHDLSRRQWIAPTAQHVPETVALLQQYGGDWVRTALFSRLDPNAVLEAHTGWADLANHVYRIHIPIDIPEQSICGTWVDGCVVLHRPDALVAFDDSKIHRAFHYTHVVAPTAATRSRTVLIVDVARPSHLPLGTATGGHSEELDAFIAQFASPS